MILQLDDNGTITTILSPVAGFPFFWEVTNGITNQNLLSSCQDNNGIASPDMIWNGSQANYPIFTGNTLNTNLQFSLFEFACDNQPTPDFLMSREIAGYRWRDENGTIIAQYQVLDGVITGNAGSPLVTISPVVTTTYTLERTILNFGDVDEFELCETIDAVSITVLPNSPDAGFSAVEKECDLYDFISIIGTEDDDHRGIYLVNAGNWNVSGNQIVYTGAGATPIQGTIAITAYGCSNLFIVGNNISATSPGAFYNGILVSNTVNSTFCCNSIDNGNTNLFFFGHCENTIAQHTSIGNASRGLRQWAGTVVGEYNPLLGRFEHLHRGNLWTGAYSWVGARNLGDNDDVQQSVFLVEGPPFSSSFWPAGIQTPNTTEPWFIDFPGSVSISICDDASDCTPPGKKDDTKPDQLRKLGAYSFTGSYSEMLNWEGQQYRLARLNAISDLVDRDINLFNFTANNTHTTLGQYQALRKASENLHQFSDGYYTVANEMQELNDRLMAIYQQIVTETDVLIIQDLVEQEQIILEALSLRWPDFTALKTTDIELQKEMAMTLHIDNQSLPIPTVFTQNEQIVNEVYLATIAGGVYHLNDQQFNLIRPIAEQCVMEGGKVVYRARALYQLAERRHFDDEKICSSIQALQSSSSENGALFEEAQTKQGKKRVDQITIYPNPTQHFLQVDLPDDLLVKSVYLQLFSIQGQAIQNWTYDHTGSHRLDIKGIPAGIYWLNISLDGAPLLKRKVVILP